MICSRWARLSSARMPCAALRTVAMPTPSVSAVSGVELPERGKPQRNNTQPGRSAEMGKLDGKRIAILATDGVEQVELTKPREALEAEGATTELVSLEAGEIQGFEHLDHADKLPVDKTVHEVSADDYDGLLFPGGVANGDFLRSDEDAVKLVAAFA